MDLSTLITPLSWFDESREFLGLPSRPLSLASRQAIGLMGLRLLVEDPEYSDRAAEVAELYAYAWLHTAPLAEVCEGLWSGGWRATLSADPVADEVIADWRETRLRLALMCAAVDYDVRAKPRPAGSATAKNAPPPPPSDMLEPTRFAFRLRLLMRDTGASREDALWHWPYAQAVQIIHAAQRWEDQWTVRALARTAPPDFEGFGLAVDTAEAT